MHYTKKIDPTGHTSKLVPNEVGITPAKFDTSHLPDEEREPYPTLGCYERRARYFRDHLDMELPRWWSPVQTQAFVKRRGCLITREILEEDLISEEFKIKAEKKRVFDRHQSKRFNK